MRRRYARSEFYRGLVHEPIPHAYRIIRRVHRETPLGVRAAPSRFGDPNGRFAVLYAAADIETALWEAVLRDRPAASSAPVIARAELEEYLIVELASTRALRLLDLGGRAPRALGAPTSIIGDRRHRAGQALSAALHSRLPTADGLLYPSRFTQESCIAVYERGLAALTVREMTPLTAAPEVIDTLERCRVELEGPPK